MPFVCSVFDVMKGRGIELREVWLELQKPEHGLLQAHRYRLRSYPNTLVASEIVDWLLERGCAGPNRSQACVLGQALLDSKRIEHMTGEVLFKDEYTLYRPGLVMLCNVGVLVCNCLSVCCVV